MLSEGGLHWASVIHISKSVAQTESLATELAGHLRGGEVIALSGEMGAGKTQFVRGLVRGLGGNVRAVSSPTFVLLNIYETPKLKLYHLDAYRVAGEEDFEAIGFSELLEEGGIVVVEWPERVEKILPPKRIEVKIESTGVRSRRISIEET